MVTPQVGNSGNGNSTILYSQIASRKIWDGIKVDITEIGGGNKWILNICYKLAIIDMCR